MSEHSQHYHDADRNKPLPGATVSRKEEVLQSLLEAARGQITDLTAEVTSLASKLADAQAVPVAARVADDPKFFMLLWIYGLSKAGDESAKAADALVAYLDSRAIAAPVVQVAGGEPSELNVALAENDRLRDALADKISGETLLTELNMNRGGLNMQFEGGACQMLAEQFAQQFREMGGDNYIEMGFTARYDGMPLLVTIQRVSGKTPATLKTEAEAKLATAKNFHRSLCDRFGYSHDDKDWLRDLISLEEFIAAKVSARAADALDSQPTEAVALLCEVEGMQDIAETYASGAVTSDEFEALRDRISAFLSSQPTDGEVRNG